MILVIDECQTSMEKTKDVRKTLEQVLKMASGSFKAFDKLSLPQPLVPPKHFGTRVYNLINMIDFEYEALDVSRFLYKSGYKGIQNDF